MNLEELKHDVDQLLRAAGFPRATKEEMGESVQLTALSLSFGSVSLSVVTERQARRMRWRSSVKPARPCIWRMMRLVLVFTPSVPPLW
ncbi:hypothetical protein GCM10023075_81460 [Streptosporangium album]